MTASIDKHLSQLQQQVGGLYARVALPDYANAPGEQAQILGHFLRRALQMSEASGLICRARLAPPDRIAAHPVRGLVSLLLGVDVRERRG
jgi:hypothetical protein